MTKKSEKEFVEEGFSEAELTRMNGDSDTTVADSPAEQADVDQSADGQQQGDAAAQQEPKMVDVRALQEARAAERAAREELAKFRNEQIERARQEAVDRAKLEERISLINQAMEAQNKAHQPQKVVPNKDEDVLGYYDHQFESVEGKFQTLEQKLADYEKQQREAVERNVQHQQKLGTINEAGYFINIASQQNPQIQEAIDFTFAGMRNDIAAELERRGVPVAQRAQIGDEWLFNMTADLATKCPRDPAMAADFVMRNARFYGYGYQPQQAPTTSQQQATQQIAQPAAKTPQERAEQQQRHMSLSGVQGGQPPLKLDAKSLASMSDAQFNELMKTAAGRKQIEEVMGGV